jgi:hypothetical protein
MHGCPKPPNAPSEEGRRRPDPEVRLDLTVIPGGHHLLKLWSQLEHFADGEIGC